MSADGGGSPRVWRRFFGECVRPYLGLQVEIAVCLALGVALELVDPLIIKTIVDRALGDGDLSVLVLLVAILGGVLLFRVAFRLVSVWLYSYSGLRILFDFRQRAFEHALRLSPYYYRSERTGDILARLTADIDVLQRAAAHTVVNAVHDVLTIAGIITVLFWLDPGLAWILLLVYPLLAVLLARINRRLRTQGLKARQAVSNLFTFFEERIANIRLVQELVREKAEARRHVGVSRPWIASNLRLSVLGAGQVSLADAMATGAFMVVFLMGGVRVLEGTLSLGSLVAFYAFANRMYRPISGLIDINVDLQVARAALGRVYELLDQTPDVEEADDAVTPDAVSGRLELRDVGLSWPGGQPVLEHVDLEVPAGQVVALVGPSGSGKSTLAALLARYVDAGTGEVSIDGLDVRRWTLRGLREAVALVPQETQLFHDKLASNLRLARRDATDAELRDALGAVELGAFVDTLPAGLDTIVGEQGLRLSGGERQRLALARMLLQDATVHVLDEATSALDPRTERRVLASLLERLAGRTLIVIAHRLSTVRHVDRIVVLSEGRIVESGRHAELYAAGGLYRRLYDDQTAPASRAEVTSEVP